MIRLSNSWNKKRIIQNDICLKVGVESGVESGVEPDMSTRIIALLEKESLAKSEIAKRLGKAKPSRYLNDLMRKLF